ncbi:MBL fold metallo-hydrolase [Candidatus Xianfuyuplasma coldseepsis]|uniref:MBL fold metallo-hydrolase n=1 Tax=Candidatus Xianfuyuplasma coldseepsis TaxID=2782163 RepID=A0A7L7KP19_9MOLU|nr:MBL fold metallo-hydrolase [Xianfuyuplasma coldseepsis]QMS84453.1 MBL fold metallo-hydrolase [Xianfuyuplasma coldseepsis]
MKWTILASGSGGNTTYLESNGVKLLIDCGITYRQITTRLKAHNHSIDPLDAVLITHEHGDHIKGLDVTMKRHNATTYMTKDTYDGLPWRVKDNVDPTKIEIITPYEPFFINHLKITPISISHDASDAVGYVIEDEDKKLVYVTDIGYLPKRDYELFTGADAYIFESNYDVTMLFTSSRPFYLKQRIDSVKGHMSNNDSAYNLAQLVRTNTKYIILAHRSRECNTDELVLQTYQDVFADYGLTLSDYEVCVAKQDIPTKLFKL